MPTNTSHFTLDRAEKDRCYRGPDRDVGEESKTPNAHCREILLQHLKDCRTQGGDQENSHSAGEASELGGNLTAETPGGHSRLCKGPRPPFATPVLPTLVVFAPHALLFLGPLGTKQPGDARVRLGYFSSCSTFTRNSPPHSGKAVRFTSDSGIRLPGSHPRNYQLLWDRLCGKFASMSRKVGTSGCGDTTAAPARRGGGRRIRSVTQDQRSAIREEKRLRLTERRKPTGLEKGVAAIKDDSEASPQTGEAVLLLKYVEQAQGPPKEAQQEVTRSGSEGRDRTVSRRVRLLQPESAASLRGESAPEGEDTTQTRAAEMKPQSCSPGKQDLQHPPELPMSSGGPSRETRAAPQLSSSGSHSESHSPLSARAVSQPACPSARAPNLSLRARSGLFTPLSPVTVDSPVHLVLPNRKYCSQVGFRERLFPPKQGKPGNVCTQSSQGLAKSLNGPGRESLSSPSVGIADHARLKRALKSTEYAQGVARAPPTGLGAPAGTLSPTPPLTECFAPSFKLQRKRASDIGLWSKGWLEKTPSRQERYKETKAEVKVFTLSAEDHSKLKQGTSQSKVKRMPADITPI
ncbi:PREDICTED: uncharacterized protein LOC102009437 [Chinchilla lanigera]|uniref:uncharacterized protein LOC102009437 n=1 Tax=Chinchilla lanigera TaxID=34839 RepID=UPI0006960291|nr:PREDICTED: uncharacterized protein LOC102009437 [Chinchilla lanigera]